MKKRLISLLLTLLLLLALAVPAAAESLVIEDTAGPEWGQRQIENFITITADRIEEGSPTSLLGMVDLDYQTLFREVPTWNTVGPTDLSVHRPVLFGLDSLFVYHAESFDAMRASEYTLVKELDALPDSNDYYSRFHLDRAGAYVIQLRYTTIPAGYTFALAVADAEPVPAPEQPVEPTPASPFVDIPADAWFAEPVAWAVEQGIAAGVTDTEFFPGDTCTDAQILTFLHRAAGCPAPTLQNPFADLDPTAYYADAVLWACEQGLIAGDVFEPNRRCTRAMTVEYLWKQAGHPETAVSDRFADVPADASFAQGVAWAVEQGVTQGTGDAAFSPEMTCTRGEIVTFLHRAFG